MAQFTIATRGSDLALTQCSHVAHSLRSQGLDVQIKVITTYGDTSKESLTQMGGIGVFVARIRQALLDEQCDLAVHSFKDLPTTPVDGLTIGAIPERADCRDALCARDGLSLRQLPEGSTIGTGSPRRAAQLLALRPDLHIVDIRGNVPTRLGRVQGNKFDGVNCQNDLDAVILAKAGLDRLGLGTYITDTFGPERLLPAAAQGALAVECRSADLATNTLLRAVLSAIDHEPTRLEVLAERAVMSTLQAGCAAPVGTWAKTAFFDPSPVHSEISEGEAVACLDDGETSHAPTRLADDVGQPPRHNNKASHPGLGLDAAVVAIDGTRSVSSMQATMIDKDLPLSEKQVLAQQLGQAVGEELIELGAATITDLQATKKR
ncbi:MAG: hydroxymethylbilane synthase [Actinomycetaceae bacterium]|nr:hydroxymethylbilane synthase [Actinomycetaceae bacterium]